MKPYVVFGVRPMIIAACPDCGMEVRAQYLDEHTEFNHRYELTEKTPEPV